MGAIGGAPSAAVGMPQGTSRTERGQSHNCLLVNDLRISATPRGIHALPLFSEIARSNSPQNEAKVPVPARHPVADPRGFAQTGPAPQYAAHT